MKHIGECATDEASREVCESLYRERTEDCIALCAALRAVYALAGENKEIARIVREAIEKHGVGNV